MEKLIDIQSSPVAPLMGLLLRDKSTKKNIIWATDTYEELGYGFTDKERISLSLLLQHADIIKPRIQKSQEAQQERTRKKAEVFTPAWLCNLMNNDCDKEWFGRKDVFNAENDDHTWTVVDEPIEFPKRKTWKHYVDLRRLEITCGEAPYLVSRYDVSTGQLIVPPKRRIGQLDRKLRIVNENAVGYDEWVKWVIRAFEASYGYEYQGDNLLIARINFLLTFIDYYKERWDKEPDEKLQRTVTNKIVWNIWQMDGLKATVPLGKPYEEYHQMTLFDMYPEITDMADEEPEAIPCKIYNWRRDNAILFKKLKEMKVMGHKLFNFVIGNPPYQDETANAGDRKPPVYNLFMDQAYKISSVVELITPARFLFNAGQTPKAWNEKMLKDSHLKVLNYESDASSVFPNTDIKGGVVVTYRNDNKDFGEIEIFTAFSELNEIIRKVNHMEKDKLRFNSIIASQGLYRFSQRLFEEHPEITKLSGAGTGAKIVSSIMTKAPEIFKSRKFKNSIRMLGRVDGKREYRYISRSYIEENSYIDCYNLFLPEANNSGHFGETLTLPTLGLPGDGSTDTFLSTGQFYTKEEPNNLSQYLKTKFFRTMLGVKKVTQHCPPKVWAMIPLQDFTSNSDIDWSKSVHEIDLQLYRKYGLDEKEINFIESHVKEMA